MLRSISCPCSPYTHISQQIRLHTALGFLPGYFPSEAVHPGGGQPGHMLRETGHLSAHAPEMFPKESTGRHGTCCFSS